MNPTTDLERLISRYLDREDSPTERRALEALLRRDPQARELLTQTAAIDRAVARALCQAMGRPCRQTARALPWTRVGQFGLLAAAACVALALWVGLPRQAVSPGPTPSAQAGWTSWFSPQPSPTGDLLRRIDPSHERPRQRWQTTDRDWIIVPGQRPGEYFLIELDRVRTCAVVIEDEF